MNLYSHLAPGGANAPASGIVEIASYGRSKPGVTALWTGESDLPTPDFICEAAAKALAAGETFYTWNRGIPELREALGRYHERHFQAAGSPERHIVVGSGMQAIQLAIQAVAGAGDEIVYLSPAWPNFAAALGIAGGRPVAVELEFDGGWKFDLGKLVAALTPRTKAIFFNSPSNPTGWVADQETLAAVLDIARQRGLWIIADETYALFHYGEGRAPSFMDIMEDDDLVVFANTFSKNWAMTGWRIGWLTVHPSLQQVFENLVQYSTSGVPQFLQKGAVEALDQGDAFLAEQVLSAKRARDLVCAKLGGTNRVYFEKPKAAFYLMFAIDGITDSQRAVFDIVDHAKVGLAPGTAFGVGGEKFFRLCFHRSIDQLDAAMDRLAGWISSSGMSG